MGSAKFDAGDVMRIATFDIRLCNLDRHAGNVLVARSTPYQARSAPLCPPPSEPPRSSRSAPVSYGSLLLSSQGPPSPNVSTSSYRLVPIDHGFCLPHILQLSDVTFTWLNWHQTKLPVPDNVKEYVAGLNGEADCSRIRRLVGAAIPDTHLLTLKVCTKLLQYGLSQGLTLYDVGIFMIVDNAKATVSKLQALVNMCIRTVLATDLCKSQLHSISPRRGSPGTVQKDSPISDEMLHHAMSIAGGESLWTELSSSIELAVKHIIDASQQASVLK